MAHHNTVFSQPLKLVPKHQFEGLAASTIAACYKQRWQIKLFFKWIKQNLKIKAFLGTSKNAVMTQIWIALCMFLMPAYLKYLSKITGSLQHIIRLLQLNLFAHRDLTALLLVTHPTPSRPNAKLSWCSYEVYGTAVGRTALM